VWRWQFQGLDALQVSLAQEAGILLTVNHCRLADPLAVAQLGLELNQFFYYVVAYHQFKQGRISGWVLNRLGGFSLWREGTDRESLRTSARLLADAERPLVIFPEGTWFRQNDRLGPIQEGFTLILRQAARLGTRPLAVHPVGLKYWLLEDPRPILCRRLEALERKIGWRSQQHLDLVTRIEKLASALLAIKEIEHWGSARTGSLDGRIQRLAEAYVCGLERSYLGRAHDDYTLKRIRRLRQVLVRQLTETGDPDRVLAARQALEDLVFCENLSAHSHDYLLERPSLERLTEAVLRIEETVTDEPERLLAPVGVTGAVGPALDVRARLNGAGQDLSPLAQTVATSMQKLLDTMLAQGPPPSWNCPTPVEGPLALPPPSANAYFGNRLAGA
jgi:hypothetical protein